MINKCKITKNPNIHKPDASFNILLSCFTESRDEGGNVSRLVNWSTRKSMNGRIPIL